MVRGRRTIGSPVVACAVQDCVRGGLCDLAGHGTTLRSSAVTYGFNPFRAAGDYKTCARARQPPPVRSEPLG
eukprot:6805115-Prymnesium_polylepis.1